MGLVEPDNIGLLTPKFGNYFFYPIYDLDRFSNPGLVKLFRSRGPLPKITLLTACPLLFKLPLLYLESTRLFLYLIINTQKLPVQNRNALTQV